LEQAQSSRTFLYILAAVCVLVLGIIMRPKIAEQLAPKLEAVYVAIEPEGSDLATVGRVELVQGQTFTLRAVLEAQTRKGEKVYYTDAKRLKLGNEEIQGNRLERFSRSGIVKLRWFTIEGTVPFLKLEPKSGIQGFRMEEFARPDWPMAWSIPGELDAANDNHYAGDEQKPTQSFGTQRYHVRFETYEQERALVPIETLRSWGVGELKKEIDRFPTAVVSVPGPAGLVSKLQGLSQLEPPAEAGPELLRQIDDLTSHGLAFSRFTLLRDLAAAHGRRWQDLQWRTLSLDGTTLWSAPDAEPTAVGPGDLLRAGNRVVVLYRDAGEPGKLDPADLAFDFERGLRLGELKDFFSGEGDLEQTALGAAQQ